MGRFILLALVSCAAIAPLVKHQERPPAAAIIPVCRPPDEAPDIGAVFVKSLATDHAVVQFEADVREGNVTRFLHILDDANRTAGLKYVVLQLDTPGGNVSEGRRMQKAIEESKVPVYCVVTVEAASAGFYIFQSCAQRMMLAGAKLMAHEIFMPWVLRMDRYDAKRFADDLEQDADKYITYEAHRLTISRDEFVKRTHGKDWEMGSVEALAVGAADEIVEDLDLTLPARPTLPSARPTSSPSPAK